MIYHVRISQQADLDLRQIYKYIALVLESPEAAAGQLDRLENAISNLRQMPKRFVSYQREPWRTRGLRIMPADNYIVLYIPDDNTATVTILRVMYGGRDMDDELKRHSGYDKN